ncbi:hypothetical protein [Nocardia sp. NPDC059195]|uniref:hypothetical protein n=1 Tax=Nocardia sp. NPDC059195 TaxID=3346765 RepID=UPI0036B5B20D
MSSGPDDRRDDPTVFGGPGAPNQPDQQWQRPGSPDPVAGQPNQGTPDPTAVWTPGSTGLPPTLRWDGSGPPPGLPEPTSWAPAGPQDWQDPGNPAAGQQGPPPGQGDPTQLHQPPLPWPGANPPAGQPGSNQPWQPGMNPPAGQHPPGQQWQPAAPQPGMNPPTGQQLPAQHGQPADPQPGMNPPAGQQPPGQWGAPVPPGQQWGAPAAGSQQPWGAAPQQPGQQQWGTPAGHTDPTRVGAPSWQQPVPQQYGEIPPLDHRSVQSYGQPFPPSQKSGNKAAIWAAAGVAALLLVGGTITAVALTRGDNAPTNTAGATPSMVSALSTTPKPTSSSKTEPSTTPPSGAASNRKPLIEGYQVVASPDRGAAYDVPAGWKVASETTIGGVGEPPGDSVIGKGYASDGRDYCPNSTRTMSLLTGSKNADNAAAGAELGIKAAPLAYQGSQGTPGPAQPLKSIDGKTEGMFTETTGTVPAPKSGCAATYSVYTYAFKGAKDGSFVMVMVADTGVPGAIDTATAKRIFSTIRSLD